MSGYWLDVGSESLDTERLEELIKQEFGLRSTVWKRAHPFSEKDRVPTEPVREVDRDDTSPPLGEHRPRVAAHSRDTAALKDLRANILSSLTPQTCARAEEVARAVGVPMNRLPNATTPLVEAALIIRFKIGARSYLAITEEGADHPRYDAAAPKARVADLEADYSVARTRCIQVLSLLGEVRTSDVTKALPPGCYGHSTSTTGQMMQQLRDQDVIREVGFGRGSGKRYSLTEKGHALAAALALFVQFPDVDELNRKITSANRMPRHQRRDRVDGGAISLPSLGHLRFVQGRASDEGG